MLVCPKSATSFPVWKVYVHVWSSLYEWSTGLPIAKALRLDEGPGIEPLIAWTHHV